MNKPPVSLYYRNGFVFIPTVAVVENGPLLEIEPVEVVAAADLGALEAAILRGLRRDAPRVPRPRSGWPAWVVLKWAKVRSAREFSIGAVSLVLSHRDGVFTLERPKPEDDGGWIGIPAQDERFPPGTTPAEVARRVGRALHALSPGPGML